ncbi:MAG TPA: TrkA family potassium uptake protein [Myxococcota bacterium]|nr:TrkA family potassium uptake protein [Myxococcota bacterium]
MHMPQILVVGLGQFGMALTRSLVAHGGEVLAIDRDEDKVAEAATFAAEAMCFDAADEAELQAVAPARRDYCVCAIGDESRESSIIVTALLRQMGAPRVIARSTDALHERILTLVGAHEIINPERAIGERMAMRLLHRGVLEMLPLGDDLVITELSAPASFVGRTLADLALPRRFQVTVVAIRRNRGGRGVLVMPSPNEPLEPGDILVIVSPPASATELIVRL